MTDREKAIIMAHTGICMLTGDKFQIFHKYIEEIMGSPVWTHEIGFLEKEIKEKSKADFIALCADESSSENPNKWIPVSERLPEERKKCFVTFKGGYVGIMCYAPDLYRVDEYDFCDEKGKAGWYDYDSEWGHYSRDDVIAWMSLPTPYKAESEDKEYWLK